MTSEESDTPADDAKAKGAGNEDAEGASKSDDTEAGASTTGDAEAEEAKADDGKADDAKTDAPAEGRGARARRFFRENYLTIDRRLLGLFRIYFGMHLFIDIVRRIPEISFFYSVDGSLSNHFNLFAPLSRPNFSLYSAFTSRGEVTFAFVLTAIVYASYVIGYRTRLCQILAVILHASLNSRNIFIENGGCVSTVIVAGWAACLPLGDRFSVDALLRSYRARKERKPSALNDRAPLAPPPNDYITIIVLGLLIQVSVVYFFNCVQKTDIAWRTGETVHWVLWQNRIATWLCGLIRLHEPSWLSPLMSWGTLVIEGVAPILLLTPVYVRAARTLHVIWIWGLHISIALLVDVGPFSYVMLGLNFLVLPGYWMTWGEERLRKKRAKREIVYDPSDAGMHALARLLARLDSLGLLSFRDRSALSEDEAEGAPKGALLVKSASTGKWVAGAAALTEASRSLLLGRALALPLGVLFERRGWFAKMFALEPGVHEDDPGLAAVLAPPPSPARVSMMRGRHVLGHVFAGIVVFTMVAQMGRDNWWLKQSHKVKLDLGPVHIDTDVKLPQELRLGSFAVPFFNGPPEPLQTPMLYLRMLQGWSMFAMAPREDGTVVVDAVTADGRHIDVFTEKEPDFEAPLHGPWYQSQLWCDYFLKIHFDGNKGYREELKKYIANWQRIEGRPPQDRIVSFDVYWVSCNSPGWPYKGDQPTNIKRTLLASSSSK